MSVINLKLEVPEGSTCVGCNGIQYRAEGTYCWAFHIFFRDRLSSTKFVTSDVEKHNECIEAIGSKEGIAVSRTQGFPKLEEFRPEVHVTNQA